MRSISSLESGGCTILSAGGSYMSRWVGFKLWLVESKTCTLVGACRTTMQLMLRAEGHVVYVVQKPKRFCDRAQESC